MNLRSLVPNSYIPVSVSDLYIPTIGLPILLHENRWTDRGNIQYNRSQVHESKIRTEAAQFLFGEYINRSFFAVGGSRGPIEMSSLLADE
jgi:hypothetical protein